MLQHIGYTIEIFIYFIVFPYVVVKNTNKVMYKMNVENPYVKEYQELVRQFDVNKTPELKQRLEQIKAKSEEFVQNIVSELDGKINSIIDRKNEVETTIHKSGVSLRQEYETAKALYRKASVLVVELRNLKKTMREMIEQNKKKRSDKGVYDFGDAK